MTTATPSGRGPRVGLLVTGILLIAANLRASLTGVGPLLDDIQQQSGLTSGTAGTLNSVPLLAFAAVSPVTPWIARRVGRERILLGALLMLTIGIVLRSLPGTVALFAGTVVVGAAIALGNVLLPEVIKHYFPRHLGVLTGVYVTTMGLVAAVASGIAVPIAGIAPGGWQTALGCWAGLSLIAAAVWAPRALGRATAADAGAAARSRAPARMPWRSALAWQVTVYMGLQSLGFYVMVAWLPSLLESQGASGAAAGWALFGYQVAGLTASLLLPLLTRNVGDQRWVAAGSAVGALVGYLGLALVPGLAVVWVLVAGLCGGACLVTSLSLIGMRAPDAAHTSALSGMAQSVGYLLAALGPILFGLLHDHTGAWTVPLLALAVTFLVLAVAGLGAGRPLHIAAATPPTRDDGDRRPAGVEDRSPIVRGVVRDLDGSPVVGAVLTLTDRSGRHVDSDTTGRSGHYRLQVGARGDHVLVAAAPMHHPTAVHAALHGPDTGLDLTLRARPLPTPVPG